jgi:hypothetical protein
VLDTYDYEQLKGLGGHEVVASDGEKVGYVDLVFRDEGTQQPEWLGIWDGLPDSKPRMLLPVRGVEVVDGAIRAPWPAETVRGAPSYEDPHDLVLPHDSVVEISPETERAAYEHYGIEPLTERPETVDVVRFRLWRIQSF